jgi:hypothetical protein
MRRSLLTYGGALALTALSTASAFAGSGDMFGGASYAGSYGYLFSDPPPGLMQPYHPNYVAPPAPPPPPPGTYIDGRLATYCRAFSRHVRVGNVVEENFGTACLQPDGTWRVMR